MHLGRCQQRELDYYHLKQWRVGQRGSNCLCQRKRERRAAQGKDQYRRADFLCEAKVRRAQGRFLETGRTACYILRDSKPAEEF